MNDIKIDDLYDEKVVMFQVEPEDAESEDLECNIIDEDIAKIKNNYDGSLSVIGYSEGETSYTCSIGNVKSNTAFIKVQEKDYKKDPSTASKDNADTTNPSSVEESQNNTNTPNVTPSPTPEPTPTIPLEYTNALQAANNYLRFMPFSYTSLIRQLNFEGYSTESATYAADNCGANWNEQAAKAAQNYIKYMAFSRQGLIDQLLFEGYSQEQAEYGVTAIGY